VVTYRPDYRDTSALAKLVFPEPESAALIEWLGEWPDRLSSALAQGVRRILRRGQASARLMARAEGCHTSPFAGRGAGTDENTRADPRPLRDEPVQRS
jgi:hypothetical protein